MKMRMNDCSRSRRRRRSGESGFTFRDLLAVLAALALIAGVVLPALAQSKPRSLQAMCVNNLRQIGTAVMLFNAENNQFDPWRAEGFGYSNPTANNIFVQFRFLTNGLPIPKVLACPSDAQARPAKDYSASPDGGFLHPNFRNAAVSYFLGLDSWAFLPDSVLSGDRNIRVSSASPGACSSGITQAYSIYSPGGSPGWAEGLHGPSGNILLHDGHVEQTSSETVKYRFTRPWDDNGSVHLQFPRSPSL